MNVLKKKKEGKKDFRPFSDCKHISDKEGVEGRTAMLWWEWDVMQWEMTSDTNPDPFLKNGSPVLKRSSDTRVMQVLLFSLGHFLHVACFLSVAESAVMTAAEQTQTTTMTKGRKIWKETNCACPHLYDTHACWNSWCEIVHIFLVVMLARIVSALTQLCVQISGITQPKRKLYPLPVN